MSKWKKRIGILVVVLGVPTVAVYLANTSRLADPLDDGPFVVAHRGMAQGFLEEGLTGKTCTASRMTPPRHAFLENTLPSMAAAFDHGAQMVEFDVHLTADGQFAVFHDWTVECRTEGSGETGAHTLAQLKTLDVGYGYTADGGETWPFRGQGVGMVPSLEEVLAAFPDRDFLIDVKSGKPEVGAALTERLASLTAGHEGEIMVHGAANIEAAVRDRLPHLRTVSRPRLKRCLKRYIALGWSGHVPSACENMLLTVPANVAPWLWGWPNRLLQRMDAVGTQVVVIGDYGGEGFSSGFDDPARLNEFPEDYSGGIWTDAIDLIGPALGDVYVQRGRVRNPLFGDTRGPGITARRRPLPAAPAGERRPAQQGADRRTASWS